MPQPPAPEAQPAPITRTPPAAGKAGPEPPPAVPPPAARPLRDPQTQAPTPATAARPTGPAEPVIAAPAPAPIREAKPRYRDNPAPRYPILARKRGYQGTVILDVLIDENGRVADTRIFSSSGYSLLDKAARATVADWLFEPGMQGDEKIEMWVKVPIRFQLK